MSTIPLQRSFETLDASAYFTEPTPPALLEDLLALDGIVLAAATTPYAGTCYHCDGATEDAVAWVVNGATRSLRVDIARSSDYSTTGAALDDGKIVELGGAWYATSPSAVTDGTDAYPPGEVAGVSDGSTAYVAVPTADQPRALALTEQMAPQVAWATWRYGCAVSVRPILVADVEAI